MTFTFPSSGQDKNLEVVDGKRRLQYLPFVMRPIFQAVTDWTTMFEEGSVRLPAGKKGSNQFVMAKTFSFNISGADFTTAYEKIRDVVNVLRQDGASGMKRKIGANERDESKAKRAKNLQADAEDF